MSSLDQAERSSVVGVSSQPGLEGWLEGWSKEISVSSRRKSETKVERKKSWLDLDRDVLTKATNQSFWNQGMKKNGSF